MQRIKKMLPGNIYLLKGECGANSVFFENEYDAILFMKYVENYLGNFVVVNSFCNNKDGWVLVITIKSEAEVIDAYEKRRSKSKRCKNECSLDEVWRIISDQMRMLLSRYVKTTNAISGREGGKVKSSYKRYYFDSVEEAVEVMKQMDNQEIDQSQTKGRYQGAEELFSFTEEELKENVYMCSKGFRKGGGFKEFWGWFLDLLDYSGVVLQGLVLFTLKSHLSTNST